MKSPRPKPQANWAIGAHREENLDKLTVFQLVSNSCQTEV
jgi:hypothetical protein